MQTRRRSRLLEGLGRNVIVLGVVSFLTDISSEMLYPIVPFVYGAACALAAAVLFQALLGHREEPQGNALM